jgi:putative tricarboxylic transport membrane protein
LTIIASLSGKSLLKGMLSGLLGIALSFVGMAPVDAVTRFTFGQYQLLSGFSIIVLMIGLFAVRDIIKAGYERKHLHLQNADQNFKLKGFGLTLKEFKQQGFNLIRSSIIGLGIGILPGIGGSIAGLLSYSSAKNASKHPEKFGTGIVDGLVASETANNAVIGGSLIPLLTMGIPGNTATAVFLGGLMIHGISPGPLIFYKSGDIMFGIFTALIIANICMIVFEFFGLKVFVKLLDVPKHILLPIIMVLCMIGAYSNNVRIFDVWGVVGFGVLGILMMKLNIPSTPLIIGFILGSMAERNLRQALMASKGSWLVFITRPVSLVLLIIAVVSIILVLIKSYKVNKNRKAVSSTS